NKLVKEFGEFQIKVTRNMTEINENFKTSLDKNMKDLISSVELKFEGINNKVEERLKTGFEKTNETFKSIIERLAKIDEAQKKIEALSGNIISLQDILTDKKSRGIFGEVQLYQIMSSVFGAPNDKTYQTQYKLSNDTMADAVLFAPEPVGTIAIDSKFPLENYKRLMDRTLSDADKKIAESNFKSDMKKHIDAISSKYIIMNETADQAILFLPAEAIFAELNAYHGDIIEYAQKRKVWIASPTTLMAVLNTLQVVLHNIELAKNTHIIQEQLKLLKVEFGRYRDRWDKLSVDIEKVSKDVKDINTTSEKITKKFESIANVEIEEISHEENEQEKINLDLKD
ncbi:MAG: DNA recombination protein RmuC, partial [Fusobacteriaceae bacterium]